jgi:hypothetical protein
VIIKDIQLTRTSRESVLSAKCKIRKIGWDEIYFSVDTRYDDYICEDASPFATALLLPAMKQGEDLIIDGSISAQLWTGMQAAMREVLQWDIGLKPVAVKPQELTPDTGDARKTATFFSGGVDSFYTFLKHKGDPDAARKIDSLLFINNGFDIDPRNKVLWDIALKNITAVAQDEGVDLVVAKSNINSHLLSRILPWDYIHGACLAAMGQFMRRGFRRIYIPSTHSTEEQIPWGSHPALDKLWSTEALTFEHDGSETTRVSKIVSGIAESPTALRHLRVCYMNEKGAYNCGKCDKCMRTMVGLYIAGALERAGTFPHHLDIERIAATPTIKGADGGIFHDENLTALKQRNLAPELQRAITDSLDRTAELELKSNRTDGIRDRVIYLDHVYARGHAYHALSSLFGKKFS